MSKTINATLLSHLAGPTTTTCLIARVATKDGTVYGFADLDVDLVYDDGDGAVTYYANNGFTPSRLDASADTSVDNAEMQGWVSATGITLEQIRAGLFDYAEVKIYKVNYNDLTTGRHEIMATGTAGETDFSRTGWKTEFRALKQQLKQTISQPYSLTCRAKFGSMPIGTGGAQPEEKHPCGKTWTWGANGTVTAVGANPRRNFTDTGRAEADNYYTPGVIEWLTGDNAGLQMEVDTHAADAFGLSMPLPFAIQVGDTYRPRQDCSKIWDDTAHGCKYHWSTDWSLHFRGEPLIPVSDGGTSLIPGAEINR